MFKNKTRQGFTLAEVLITLGIIGVVAAMTIPTLVVDINTKQWGTAKNVFEKKLNESLKTMNTQQTISGHATTLSFVEELAKHFKINKICKNDELQNCFSETVYWGAGEATPEAVDMTTIKQASHFGLEDWGTELIGVQFANGVSGLVAYNPTCSGDPYSNQFEGTKCISVLYDVSGFKNPNTKGKDVGNYGVINRLGDSGCAIELAGICFGAPFKPTAVSNAECQEMLASGEYSSIRHCPEWDDPWLGAVKQCGGLDKMISPEELMYLAQYLYDDSSLSNYEIMDVNLNNEKVQALGFSQTSIGGEFVVWSNSPNWWSLNGGEFGGVGSGTVRVFADTYSYFYDDHAGYVHDAYAICKL